MAFTRSMARQFNFQGVARMDAKVSEMVTGWKSVMLKLADPLFHEERSWHGSSDHGDGNALGAPLRRGSGQDIP